jgi:hypothetical protein
MISKARVAILALLSPFGLACGGTTPSAPTDASTESSSTSKDGAADSSSTPNDGSAESTAVGEGGCLMQEPEVDASCTGNESVCEQGDPCCIGYEWTCTGGHWSKLGLGCSCQVDAGSDAADEAGPADAGPFMCGTHTCDPQRQYCEYAYSNVPTDAGPSMGCASFDAGCATASCACIGASVSATSPGSCGCYQSSSGAVTNAFCPP